MVIEKEQIAAFRADAAMHQSADDWITPSQQRAVWKTFLDRLGAARSAGLDPVVCVDLDLTSLLAPAKSRDVLAGLAARASQLPLPDPRMAPISELLSAIWRGEESALLPGYTSTSLHAYGVYLVAQLQQRTGLMLENAARDACEAWVEKAVFDVLRSGYWNRDLSQDEPSPGFQLWSHEVLNRGGIIIFLSNRDPSFRDVSLASIVRLLGSGVAPCVFFGPGGSQFDASSKAVAIARIEEGVIAGVNLGVANAGQTEFPDARPIAGKKPTIIAVIDDRAENRKQILEAASGSAARLSQASLPAPMDIASAATGFCPEIDVAGMETVVSSFLVEGAA